VAEGDRFVSSLSKLDLWTKAECFQPLHKAFDRTVVKIARVERRLPFASQAESRAAPAAAPGPVVLVPDRQGKFIKIVYPVLGNCLLAVSDAIVENFLKQRLVAEPKIVLKRPKSRDSAMDSAKRNAKKMCLPTQVVQLFC
jgi:hypothetical protein